MYLLLLSSDICKKRRKSSTANVFLEKFKTALQSSKSGSAGSFWDVTYTVPEIQVFTHCVCSSLYKSGEAVVKKFLM